MDSARCVVCAGLLLSVTRMVKFEVPVAVGVPVMFDPLIDNPAGSDPDAMDQVYGVSPPDAASGCDYDNPCVPAGSELVLIAMGVLICTEKSFSLTWDCTVTRIRKLNVPATVGVPPITPLDASDNPLGKDPETTLQTRWPPGPPLDAIVCE